RGPALLHETPQARNTLAHLIRRQLLLGGDVRELLSPPLALHPFERALGLFVSLHLFAGPALEVTRRMSRRFVRDVAEMVHADTTAAAMKVGDLEVRDPGDRRTQLPGGRR